MEAGKKTEERRQEAGARTGQTHLGEQRKSEKLPSSTDASPAFLMNQSMSFLCLLSFPVITKGLEASWNGIVDRPFQHSQPISV